MTVKLHFTLLAVNKVKLEKMNNSTESDFLEFLQNFQITYLPENGILAKSKRFLYADYVTIKSQKRDS